MIKRPGANVRRAILSGVAVSALMSVGGAAWAQDASGELVILQWLVSQP